MTKKIDREAIIAELRREALSDPETGWLSDLARKGLDWSGNDEVIMLRHVDGSVDVGHLAEVVGHLIAEATKPLLSRLEQAEQAVARVREVIRQYGPDCLTCMCNSDGDCCKCTVSDFQEALDGDGRG